MPGIVFAECPSVSLRPLSLRLSVLVRHTCMAYGQVVVLSGSSYIRGVASNVAEEAVASAHFGDIISN